jgi:hypothetical protein
VYSRQQAGAINHLLETTERSVCTVVEHAAPDLKRPPSKVSTRHAHHPSSSWFSSSSHPHRHHNHHQKPMLVLDDILTGVVDHADLIALMSDVTQTSRTTSPTHSTVRHTVSSSYHAHLSMLWLCSSACRWFLTRTGRLQAQSNKCCGSKPMGHMVC